MENIFSNQIILMKRLVNIQFQLQLVKVTEPNHGLNGLLSNMEKKLHSEMLQLTPISPDAIIVGIKLPNPLGMILLSSTSKILKILN